MSALGSYKRKSNRKMQYNNNEGFLQVRLFSKFKGVFQVVEHSPLGAKKFQTWFQTDLVRREILFRNRKLTSIGIVFRLNKTF